MRFERLPMERQRHRRRRIFVGAIHSISCCPHCHPSQAGIGRRQRRSTVKRVNGREIVAQELRCRVNFDRRLDSARDGQRDRSAKVLDQRLDALIRERENSARRDSKGNEQGRQSLGLRKDRQDLAAGDPVRLCRGLVGRNGKKRISLPGAFRLVLRERSKRAAIAGNLDLVGGKRLARRDHLEPGRLRQTERVAMSVQHISVPLRRVAKLPLPRTLPRRNRRN